MVERTPLSFVYNYLLGHEPGLPRPGVGVFRRQLIADRLSARISNAVDIAGRD
jgi:hypothetical protein